MKDYLIISLCIILAYFVLIFGIGVIDAMCMADTREEIVVCQINRMRNWELLFPSNRVACWLLEDVK